MTDNNALAKAPVMDDVEMDDAAEMAEFMANQSAPPPDVASVAIGAGSGLKPKVLKSNTPPEAFEEDLSFDMDQADFDEGNVPVRSRKTPARQRLKDAQQSQLQNRVAFLENENAELAEALSEVEAELTLYEDAASGKPVVSPSEKEIDYINMLLSSAGVPESDPNGDELSLADRVVFVTSQHAISTGALQMLRNELMTMAHHMNKNGNSTLSSELLELLRNSNKLGNIVAVSDIDEA